MNQVKQREAIETLRELLRDLQLAAGTADSAALISFVAWGAPISEAPLPPDLSDVAEHSGHRRIAQEWVADARAFQARVGPGARVSAKLLSVHDLLEKCAQQVKGVLDELHAESGPPDELDEAHTANSSINSTEFKH